MSTVRLSAVEVLPTFSHSLIEYRKSFQKAESLGQIFTSNSRYLKELKEEPEKGTSIGDNCYKIRLVIAIKCKGKSGGGRIITHFVLKDDTVYLFTIYDKSEIESFTDK